MSELTAWHCCQVEGTNPYPAYYFHHWSWLVHHYPSTCSTEPGWAIGTPATHTQTHTHTHTHTHTYVYTQCIVHGTYKHTQTTTSENTARRSVHQSTVTFLLKHLFDIHEHDTGRVNIRGQRTLKDVLVLDRQFKCLQFRLSKGNHIQKIWEMLAWNRFKQILLQLHYISSTHNVHWKQISLRASTHHLANHFRKSVQATALTDSSLPSSRTVFTHYVWSEVHTYACVHINSQKDQIKLVCSSTAVPH